MDFIESSQNKKAVEFSDEEYIYWAEIIDAVESQLDPEPTPAQVESANIAINEIFPPSIKGKPQGSS